MKIKEVSIILLFSFMFVNNTYAQNKLIIKVKNALSQPLETVNVQVIYIKSNKIVAFGITDEKGIYSTDVNENGKFKIKATYIGYEPTYKEFELISNQSIEIVLVENNNYLKEVIVKATSNGMKQKGDTLTYTVERFMNGTEETLRDIIKKLPGLDINSNGQITSNGKEVDKILVDGEDFFQNQHKLATENLTAQMIKNVELIKNYKEFKNLDNDTKTNTTAININIKDEFKNRITGNIQTAVGYSQKYKLHTNLFSFRKKIKTTLISGFNNTGEQEFTMFDYYSLINANKTSDETSSSIEIPNQDDIPKFLFTNNNAKSRKSEFFAFNSVYTPTTKLKLYLYSILNNSKQIQEQATSQDYVFENNPFTNSEKNNILENNLFNSTNIQTTYKPNKQNIINLTSTINIVKTITNNNIENLSTSIKNIILDENKLNRYSINNILEYSKAFQNKNILTLNLSQNTSNNSNIKLINSNNPFLGLLFNNNNFEINQTKEVKKNSLNYYAKYGISFKKYQLDLISSSTNENSSLNNEIKTQNQFENQTILETNDNYIGASFNYISKNILTYNIGLTNHNMFIKNNSNSNYNYTFLEPKATIKAIFSPNKILEINYSFSNIFPQIENIFQNKIIQDYRNIINNDNVTFKTIMPFHQLNISYFYFKHPSFNLISNISYKLNQKFININSQSNINYNLNQYQILSNEKILSAMYFVEKYFSRSKLSIKHNFVYNIFKKPITFNNIINQLETTNYNIDFKIVSSFQKFPINFETGCVFVKNIYSNSQSISDFKSTEIFQTITGKFSKSFFWSLTSNNLFQQTDLKSKNIFTLNPKIRYSKKKFDFSIYGNNILNINNTESLEYSNTNNYIEQKTNQILSGFVMFEVKYKL